MSCTTMMAPKTFRCTAWDRATGDVRRVPCEDAQRMLDERIDGPGLLMTPMLTVVSTVSPVEARPVPAPFNYIENMNAAAFPRPPKSSVSDAKIAAQWNRIERPADGTITPENARALLAVCALAPAAELEHRTVALMIVPRDDRTPVLVLLGGLLVLLLLLARSAVVAVDAERSELRVAERWGPLTRATTTVRIDDVEDVVVAQGAKGPLAASRVEIVLRGGTRVPLVRSFELSTPAHERAARALRAALGRVV